MMVLLECLPDETLVRRLGRFRRNCRHLADKGRVSIRFANGEVRTKKGGPKPGPGSEVFVPVKDTTARTNYVALFGAIAQILASTVAIIVVVTR